MSDIIVNGVLSRESEALLRKYEAIQTLKENCFDIDKVSSFLRLSEDEIHSEIKRLETQEVFKRLIWLNPYALPRPIETMNLWLIVSARDVISVAQAVCDMPGISTITYVSGKYSLFVKLHGRTTGALRRKTIDPESGLYSIRGISSIFSTYVLQELVLQDVTVHEMPEKVKETTLELVEDGTLASLAKDPDCYDALETNVKNKLNTLRRNHAIEFTLQLKEKFYHLPFISLRYPIFAYCIFPGDSHPPKNFFRYIYESAPGITDMSVPTGDIRLLIRMRSSSLPIVDQQLASMVKWNTPTRFGKSLAFRTFKEVSIAEVIGKEWWID
ncbi:MAG: Lrp/AsnC family transcriptional regulator [Candidatus Hermodarchaeota archaeon]